MFRIAFTLGLLVLSSAVMAGSDANSPSETFRFAVISDRNGGNIPGLWSQAIEEINLLRPEFVMSVGDFIEGYSKDANEINRQWDAFLGENAKLEAPFHITPGNHDETNLVEREIYVKRFGKNGQSYYSFDYRGCHFVVLDSNFEALERLRRQESPNSADKSKNVGAGLGEEQLTWLKADLAKAKDARHVFLFFHHPANEKSAVWKQLQPLLVAGKTTVFNGHEHSMTYARQNGIDTYTLAATAASTGDQGPDLGDLEMFAFVTVGDGQPAVAAITVGQMRNAKSVDRVFAIAASQLITAVQVEQTPTSTGRKVSLIQPNPSDMRFSIQAEISGSGYTAGPATIDVKPRQAARAGFEITGNASGNYDYSSPAPRIIREYVMPAPEGKKVTVKMETPLGRFSTIKKTEGMVIDAKLDDWKDIKPEPLPEFGKLLTDGSGWTGQADCSAEVRLACDDTRLYVAVDVTDDNLRMGLSPVTENDGLAFYWSVPEPWRSGEPNAPTAGSVRLIPAEGRVSPIWALKKSLQRPAGFTAMASKTEHGYICEMAMPLSEIGAVNAAETINWRLQLRDIDKQGEEANVFTIGGTTEPGESENTWITGVMKRP